LTLKKSHSKPFSDFGKKTYQTKPALPNIFSLGPKEIYGKFLRFLCFEVFTSRDFGHEANPKPVKGRPDRAALDGKPH
jgi:hypothetical protein